MKQILCFGDSNTWGYDGESRKRLPWGVRWTSLLQEKLNQEEYRIIEEGLCGRTTVFEDPLRDGRKGTALLPTLLETSADVIGKGISRLLDQIQEYAPKAEVLLISPIYLGKKVWQEEYDQEFSRESVTVSRNLKPFYEKISRYRQIEFLPAADHVKCCEADQEHLNTEGHKKFAEVVYRKLQKLL